MCCSQNDKKGYGNVKNVPQVYFFRSFCFLSFFPSGVIEKNVFGKYGKIGVLCWCIDREMEHKHVENERRKQNGMKAVRNNIPKILYSIFQLNIFGIYVVLNWCW